MDVEKVRELAELMEKHGLTEIRLRDGEKLIALRKGALEHSYVMAAPTAMPHSLAAPPTATSLPAVSATPTPQDEGLATIRSPMVGTFYASPDPESPVFVQVGSQVHKDTPVCIIEAMKVFNEIKAEVEGTIERILVTNEQPVEYGQPLMLVRPR